MQPWMISALVAVLFGGLAGAILNNVIAARKSRKQPISYSLVLNTVFRSIRGIGGRKTTITIEGESENQVSKYTNLYLATLILENVGNVERKDFAFQIVVSGDDAKIIATEETTQSSLHEVTYSEAASPMTPINKVSVTLNPFNRKDSYSVNFYLTTTDQNGLINKDQLSIATKEPVRFVDYKLIYEKNLDKAIEHSAVFPLLGSWGGLDLSDLIKALFKK